MAARLRAGAVDAVRLGRWAEGRYGSAVVAARWREAILNARGFFGRGAA